MTSVRIKYFISGYFILNTRMFFHTFQVHKDNQFFAPGTSWNFFRVFGAPARLLPQAFPASKLRRIEFWTFKRTSFSTIPTLQYTIHCQSVRTCHQVVTTKINFMTLWPIRKILSPALRPQERGSTWCEHKTAAIKREAIVDKERLVMPQCCKILSPLLTGWQRERYCKILSPLSIDQRQVNNQPDMVDFQQRLQREQPHSNLARLERWTFESQKLTTMTAKTEAGARSSASALPPSSLFCNQADVVDFQLWSTGAKSGSGMGKLTTMTAKTEAGARASASAGLKRGTTQKN